MIGSNMTKTIKLLSLSAMVSLLMACSDDDNPLPEPVTPPAPAPAPEPDNSFVRVIHASPDAPAVNILANGEILGGLEGVDYQVASGWLAVDPGDYALQVDAILPDMTTTPVINADLSVEMNTMYDVVALNTVANIQPIVIQNDFSAVGDGNIRVGVLHGAQNAPEVDIYVTAPDADLMASQPLATAGFLDYTGQVEVPAGDYQIRITPAGDGTVVFDSGSLSLAAGSDLLITATQNVGAGDSPVTLLVADGTTSFTLTDADAGAWLRVVHSVADAPAVDVIANNEAVLVDGAPFLAGTDYLPVPAADYLIDIAADADNSLVVIDDAAVTLENGMIYSAIANNTLENIALDLAVDMPRPLATAAQVRIFHSSPSAGDVDIYVTADGNIADMEPVFSAIPFSSPDLAETGYVQLAAGEYFVTITGAGNTDEVLDTTGVILNLEAAGIYTVIAVDATGGGSPSQLILLDDF